MRRKIITLTTVLLLLLSGLVITVAAKAFFESYPSQNSDAKKLIYAPVIHEEKSSAEELNQGSEKSGKIETSDCEPVEYPLPKETETYLPQKEDVTEITTQEDPTIPAASASMENTLFIGDSRTVGLSEYAELEGVEFFATAGLNVYEVNDIRLSVPNVGKVTLSELLNSRQYDRIYVMLGINELGYPFESLVKKYVDFIRYIQCMQPDSTVFIMANLHVRKNRSDNDPVINNTKINLFNETVSALADNEQIYYLDANCIFDDADGAMSEEKSGDDAHPLGKYYREWGKWIAEQTGAILS